MQTTVFQVKKIITMDANNPVATHIAINDGKIIAVGSLIDMEALGSFTFSDQFSDKVILPGFVEGHSHLLAAGMWNYLYVGFQDRIDPDGKGWDGAKSIECVLKRLCDADVRLPAGEPLIAWGFDPIFLGNNRPNKEIFDAISTKRPIAIMHSNFHVMNVNSCALKLAQYTCDTTVEGVVKDQDNMPNGELQEMAAMFPILRRLKIDFKDLGRSHKTLFDFGKICNHAGVTTAADLINDLDDEIVEEMIEVTSLTDYPIRLASMLNVLSLPAEEAAIKANNLSKKNTPKLRLGGVKLLTDGSIQAFTARLREPGYFNGAKNGVWNFAPEQLQSYVAILYRHKVPMHIHANGDEAIDITLDAIENAISLGPSHDHRITIQHCQMADQQQYRRMKELGACANLFASHIYYFGDQHKAITIGPERAEKLDSCRMALDNGVPMAVHSDAPITPMGPLTCAWAAVNRLTATGQILGPSECISVEEALYAITLGPAYTLKMDDEIGSIETGKWADFTILDEDPTAIDPVKLKDINIWGTMLGGIPHKIK